MIAENYYSDDQDLQLIFKKLVDWETVVKATEGEEFIEHKLYQETGDERYGLAPSTVDEAIELYESTLDAMGEFWGKEVSQAAGELDKIGLKYKDGKVEFAPRTIELYEKYRETGLLPYAMPREASGLGLPATMWALCTMVMARGDVSFYMTVNLLNLAQIVGRYGTPEQIERWAAPAAGGETAFAMALTEPDYGSDLSNVRTVAVKQEDGTYLLNGTKRFISQGCGVGPYPAAMLALARTGQPGARGLSAFLVNSKDCQIAGIEHKMGIHASPTCELVFEDTPGELIGKEGQGLTKFTIGMTNFMRLGCAAGGANGGAVFESFKYARERIQFGKPIEEIPIVGEMLDTMRREMNAMRLFSVETGFAIDQCQHEQIRMEKAGKTDREIRKDEKLSTWIRLSALFSSLSKYYCSEKALEMASVGVQVHGGAGYTEDYDVSRIYRDARINTIYEGTSQLHIGIGVNMIVAGMSGDGYLRRYLEDVLAEISNPSPFLAEIREMLETAVPAYRDLPDGTRERFAQHLVDLTIRYMISVLYERALERLGSDAPEHWTSDAASFHLDSAAIARSGLYKIENATRAHKAAAQPALA